MYMESGLAPFSHDTGEEKGVNTGENQEYSPNRRNTATHIGNLIYDRGGIERMTLDN